MSEGKGILVIWPFNFGRLQLCWSRGCCDDPTCVCVCEWGKMTNEGNERGDRSPNHIPNPSTRWPNSLTQFLHTPRRRFLHFFGDPRLSTTWETFRIVLSSIYTKNLSQFGFFSWKSKSRALCGFTTAIRCSCSYYHRAPSLFNPFWAQEKTPYKVRGGGASERTDQSSSILGFSKDRGWFQVFLDRFGLQPRFENPSPWFFIQPCKI